MYNAFWWFLAMVILLSASVTALYLWDMKQAYERIRDQSTVIPSPFGDIEYKEGGSRTGIPVLVIHGGGGGVRSGRTHCGDGAR
jgi:hypothetical protein